MTLDLDAMEERAQRNLVADYDCEGSARDVLALAGEVRRLRAMLGESSHIFVAGDARCSAVHEGSKAVCLLPYGHEGDHRNPSGYWMPREGEMHVVNRPLSREQPAEEAAE